MNKKILIASHRHMISEGACLRLQQEADLSVVGWVEDPRHFEKLYVTHVPNVVVICGRFQDTHTPRYIRDFSAGSDAANFLVVSNTVERHFVLEIMESGAKGFISPIHAGFDELIPAVRSVANGNTYVCQKVAETLLGGLFNRNQPIENECLSEREKQVVRLVSDGHSSKEIARILTISPSTVEVHRRNIMRKIGAHKTADITRYAIRSQLVTA
ncbi:response regulator transcription factor [Orrella daihaiensis]|uniref:Response regulator transcription factor n=1 Tax=Orrella daihaiensis TaxID=2782176 RepID=A0ABY4AL47_9BURK|nr:response regulator transcription factor [Orrella daihaiensis]UOD49792.1 response regulator transcription factor [Orrella daihaiensis]